MKPTEQLLDESDARIDAHPERDRIIAVLEVLRVRVAMAMALGERRFSLSIPVEPQNITGAVEVMRVVVEELGACCRDLRLTVRLVEAPDRVTIELASAGAA